MLFTKIISSKKLQECCNIDVEKIGDLFVSSNHIIAFDPTQKLNRNPFDKIVSNGNHNVFLYYHHSGKIALSEIRFESSISSIVRWEVATLPEENLASLTQEEIYGYNSESGLGAFIGAEGKKVYQQSLEENNEYYKYVLSQKLEENFGVWTNYTPSKNTDQNIVVFQTGWGQGTYASYWGLDQMGNAISLVTDFQLLDPEDYDLEMMHSAFNQSD